MGGNLLAKRACTKNAAHNHSKTAPFCATTQCKDVFCHKDYPVHGLFFLIFYLHIRWCCPPLTTWTDMAFQRAETAMFSAGHPQKSVPSGGPQPSKNLSFRFGWVEEGVPLIDRRDPGPGHHFGSTLKTWAEAQKYDEMWTFRKAHGHAQRQCVIICNNHGWFAIPLEKCIWPCQDRQVVKAAVQLDAPEIFPVAASFQVGSVVGDILYHSF